jgi:hypothetical protein
MQAGGGVEVLDRDGRVIGVTGGQLHVGGGEYAQPQQRFVESLIGQSVPVACAQMRYWLVSEVLD